MNAINEGNVPLLQMLMEVLLIDRPINNVGMTVFAYACANTNNRVIIDIIWAKNPNIMAVDTNLRTPLHHVLRKHIDANDLEALR